MPTLIVPDLVCPFPVTMNRHAAAVERDARTWAHQWHLLPDAAAIRRLAASQLGGLAARLHPQASRATLRLVAAWYVWGFVRDDLCDESPLGSHPTALQALNARCVAILQGGAPRPTDHPLVPALADLWQQLVPCTTRLWRQRFTRSVRAYLQATVWEALNRVQHTIPDVTTYCRMRRLTSALHTDTDLLELTTTHLPLEVLQHPVVHRLTEASINVVCWANDLTSLPKEVQRGDLHNLVLVLHHAHGGSLQAAIERTAALHTAEVQLFLDLAQRLPIFRPAVDYHLTRYVAALRARMGGSADWATASARYHLLRGDPALPPPTDQGVCR